MSVVSAVTPRRLPDAMLCCTALACRDGTPLEQRKWDHLRMAKALMYSCWRMYEVTPSGLAADVYHFGTAEDPRPKIGVRSCPLDSLVSCVCVFAYPDCLCGARLCAPPFVLKLPSRCLSCTKSQEIPFTASGDGPCSKPWKRGVKRCTATRAMMTSPVMLRRSSTDKKPTFSPKH
jgi:hypothetical protein